MSRDHRSMHSAVVLLQANGRTIQPGSGARRRKPTAPSWFARLATRTRPPKQPKRCPDCGHAEAYCNCWEYKKKGGQ